MSHTCTQISLKQVHMHPKNYLTFPIKITKLLSNFTKNQSYPSKNHVYELPLTKFETNKQ